MQYDTRTGSCVLEYNYHLGAVRCAAEDCAGTAAPSSNRRLLVRPLLSLPCSTVTFVDEGRRIVTTSEDRKVGEGTGSEDWRGASTEAGSDGGGNGAQPTRNPSPLIA